MYKASSIALIALGLLSGQAAEAEGYELQVIAEHLRLLLGAIEGNSDTLIKGSLFDLITTAQGQSRRSQSSR